MPASVLKIELSFSDIPLPLQPSLTNKNVRNVSLL